MTVGYYLDDGSMNNAFVAALNPINGTILWQKITNVTKYLGKSGWGIIGNAITELTFPTQMPTRAPSIVFMADDGNVFSLSPNGSCQFVAKTNTTTNQGSPIATLQGGEEFVRVGMLVLTISTESVADICFV